MDAGVPRLSFATRILWVVGGLFLFAFHVLTVGGATERLWGYATHWSYAVFAPGLWVGWMMIMQYQRTLRRAITATVAAVMALGVACIPVPALGWYYLSMLAWPFILVCISDFRNKSWVAR